MNTSPSTGSAVAGVVVDVAAIVCAVVLAKLGLLTGHEAMAIPTIIIVARHRGALPGGPTGPSSGAGVAGAAMTAAVAGGLEAAAKAPGTLRRLLHV